MSELINELKKLKIAQQDDSCTKKEPFIKLGKGVAPILDYNIPQSACFSTYGHHFVKGISQDMFLPATKKKPADVFKNQENWSSGDFLYNTGVNKPYDIESIDTKGYTIFWKKVK